MIVRFPAAAKKCFDAITDYIQEIERLNKPDYFETDSGFTNRPEGEYLAQSSKAQDTLKTYRSPDRERTLSRRTETSALLHLDKDAKDIVKWYDDGFHLIYPDGSPSTVVKEVAMNEWQDRIQPILEALRRKINATV